MALQPLKASAPIYHVSSDVSTHSSWSQPLKAQEAMSSGLTVSPWVSTNVPSNDWMVEGALRSATMFPSASMRP